jgi:hypothetical protein
MCCTKMFFPYKLITGHFKLSSGCVILQNILQCHYKICYMSLQLYYNVITKYNTECHFKIYYNVITKYITMSLQNILQCHYKIYYNVITNILQCHYVKQLYILKYCVRSTFSAIREIYNIYRTRWHRGRDRMVVGFTTICVISASRH